MCKQCEINPVYEFTNKRKLCKNCFIRWFEKKFLYTLRKFKMIQKGDVLGYLNSGDFRDVVLKHLLKLYFQRGVIKLVKYSGKQKIDKIAVANTTDTESRKIIDVIINKDASELNNSPIIEIKGRMIIKPLYLFLDKEVLLYAKLRGLNFRDIKEKKDKIGLFIDDLEKKHPEVKHAVVNSYLEIFENDN